MRSGDYRRAATVRSHLKEHQMSKRKQAIVGGYAIRFGHMFSDRRVYVSKIMHVPQAVLNDPDIMLRVNHLDDPIATVGDGSLRLSLADDGVIWSLTVDEHDASHMAMLHAVRQGTYPGCSIEAAFTEKRLNGGVFYATDIQKIYDVGPNSKPADSLTRIWNYETDAPQRPKPRTHRPAAKQRASTARPTAKRGRQSGVGVGTGLRMQVAQIKLKALAKSQERLASGHASQMMAYGRGSQMLSGATMYERRGSEWIYTGR